MNSPIKVSVIMPTYNVEPYFRQAIESVLRQSLAEIEIIPVDDGSPDNCGAIMDEYAEKDSRVRPIHKKNGGYGSAVNAGIRAAGGEYIAIVEPDDYIIEDLYYILYTIASENDLDICRYNSYLEVRDYMSPMLRTTYYPGEHEVLTERQLAEMFALGHPGVWMGIYRRSMLADNGIWMDEVNKAYHDVDFVALAYMAARRIKIIQTCGYYYRRDVPTQSVNDIGKAYCVIDAVRRLWREISPNAISPLQREGLYGYSLAHLFHYYRRVNSIFPSSSLAEILRKEIQKYTNTEGQQKFLCSKSLIETLVREFKVGGWCYPVDAKPAPTLKALPPINKLRQDGGYSLIDVYALAYMKFSIFISNPSPENIGLILYDLGPLIVSTFSVGNSAVIEVLKCLLKFIPQQSLLWEKPEYYVRIISYLIESGDEVAIEHFWTCRNVNDRIEREMLLYPAALTKIVDRKGTNLRDKSVYFMLTKAKSSEEKFLQNIENKAVAVVGNSPCEVGLGKGGEIDEHDIVIRFNNYIASVETKADYGSKEDVWVISPNISLLLPRYDLTKYKFIMTSAVGRECSPQACEFYSNIGEYIPFLRVNEQELVRKTVGVVLPSLGVYTLVYLRKHISIMRKMSLYGFSLIDHNEGKRHYFQGDPHHSASKIHNWQRERAFLDMFQAELAQKDENK